MTTATPSVVPQILPKARWRYFRICTDGMQGGSLGVKVLDNLRDQRQCEPIFDTRAETLKAPKLVVDRDTAVTPERTS